MAMRNQSVLARMPASGSVFEFLFARRMTTTATEVIIIKKVAMGQGTWRRQPYSGRLQIFLDNTPYFITPDRKPAPVDKSIIPIQGEQFITEPLDVFVGPGVIWDIAVDIDGKLDEGDTVCVLVEYELYDGSDAIVALQCKEHGWPIDFTHVDIYKKELIETQKNNDAAHEEREKHSAEFDKKHKTKVKKLRVAKKDKEAVQ